MTAVNAGTDVAAKQSVDTQLLITRMLDAPRELAFAVWTEPRHLERWQGSPKGMAGAVQPFDLRPGGRFPPSMPAPERSRVSAETVHPPALQPERLHLTPRSTPL